MSLASMTKPIMAALTLMLNESGVFGPGGLRCPGSALLFNRQTQAFEATPFSYPDG